MDFLNFSALVYLVSLVIGLFIAVLVIVLLFKAGALMDSSKVRNKSIINVIDLLSDTLEKMRAEKK